jgi:fumarate hydratase, class II
MGPVKVPAKAYYGAQTVRAVANFPISGLRLQRRFIRAQGVIKAAAARSNVAGGAFSQRIAKAIEKAALEVADGQWDSQFIVDVYQAGAGTSQNMNANEVIANRALELLKKPRADYKTISPNDHVNRGQSTNDTIPTAIGISGREGIEKDLLPAAKALEAALRAKSRQFAKHVKMGRTHMQDAVPLTLGQEFAAYADFIKEARRRLSQASDALSYLPLGGSAVGTGLNTVPGYTKRVITEISKITGLRFRPMANKFQGIQNVEYALEASNALRSLAVALIKIADDLRLLSSGPRVGLFEISLPAVQPGSSIMPGKVNPVMAEMLNMVCFQVLGNDATIEHSVRSAQLELNVMMPVIAYNLNHAITILSNAIAVFTRDCVEGITVNARRLREYSDRSLMLVTALTPKIGYLEAADVAKEAFKEDTTLKAVLLRRKLMTAKEIDKALNPKSMV